MNKQMVAGLKKMAQEAAHRDVVSRESKLLDLQPGMTITIYEDPLTMQKEEGEAKLITQLCEDVGDGLEMWYVEFADERGRQFTRAINKGGPFVHNADYGWERAS